MFSPLNSPAVNDWFRRLDAAWKRMPAEERTRQREEVQQHLEGLVAAKVAQGQTTEDAWNASLRQFGDPTQIGRKMYQEWRQSKTGFRADTAAVLFGLSLCLLQWIAVEISWVFGLGTVSNSRNVGTVNDVLRVYFYSSTVLLYVAIGQKYPLLAIRAALYTSIVSYLWNWAYLAFALPRVSSGSTHITWVSLAHSFAHSLLWMPLLIVGHITIAYLASVTKRGWYRPIWDDKLTLPSRRRQVG